MQKQLLFNYLLHCLIKIFQRKYIKKQCLRIKIYKISILVNTQVNYLLYLPLLLQKESKAMQSIKLCRSHN
ncbi:hypothetical protein P856_659 [Candidatus Endolissoclinum faulkneri L5]|uniref:Uncharacterized protein n=1 Tax=Candidatus Endolissoclinum faulkneri L5 TaxID=1401328 RepID=V9TVY7_9PROT|nr:hypothetical protein P856_659 [Candidatus Endolissoclinum faulkneri L5]